MLYVFRYFVEPASFNIAWLRLIIFCVIPILPSAHVVAAMDWSFNPSVTVSQQYDDNIRFSDNSVKESDFVSRLIPVVSISGESDTDVFRFDTITTGEKYYDHPSLDTVNTDSKASLNHQWNPAFSTGANVGFLHDSTLESQLEQAGIRSVRAERYHFDVGMGSKYAFTDRWSVEVSAAGGGSTYPSDIYPDSTSVQAGITPIWAVSDRDIIGLNSSFYYTDFSDTSKITTFSEILYWQRLISETLTLKIGTGYQFTSVDYYAYEVQFILPGFPILVRRSFSSNDSMPVFLADLKKDWTEKLSTTISAGRQEYNDANGASYESLTFRGSARYAFSEFTSLSLGMQYNFNDQISRGEENINYISVTPSIERKLTEHLSVALRGAYEHELSEYTGNLEATADRYRTWIELTYKWPRFLAGH